MGIIQFRLCQNISTLFKKLFPIFLYGSEIWGFSCTEMLEIFHGTFLKKNYCMSYGELGVLPLQVAIGKRMIGYWFRLLSKHDTAYSYCLYRMALTLFSNDLYKRLLGIYNIYDIALNKWYTDLSVPSLCTLFTCMIQICVLCAIIIAKLTKSIIIFRYVNFSEKKRELYTEGYYNTMPSIPTFINLFCTTNKRIKIQNIFLTAYVP